jgi:hypothetical protein
LEKVKIKTRMQPLPKGDREAQRKPNQLSLCVTVSGARATSLIASDVRYGVTLNFISSNAGAFGEGHLNLAIVEQIPARRLMDDQSMRLYNINPARGGTSVFGIDLNNGGDADEFQDQVARGFVWCERINRANHHCDLGSLTQELSESGEFNQREVEGASAVDQIRPSDGGGEQQSL